MKKNMTLFVAFFVLMAGTLQAQITIESSDMPSANDTIRLSTGLNVDFIDYTQTGEDFVWDFSGLYPVSQTVDTFQRLTDTPYRIFFFYKANLGLHRSLNIPIPGLPISNIFDYYKKTGSAYTYAGYGAMLNGIPLPLAYTNPDVIYRFPMRYGDADSSTSGLSIGIDNLGYMLIARARKNSVDGWGTLITPYGTMDVLRVKSEVTEYDSLYLDSLNAGIPLNRHYTEYKWLGKNSREPLLQITSSGFGVFATYIDSIRSNFLRIKETETKNVVTLFPNPASTTFEMVLNKPLHEKVFLKIIDQVGKSVFVKTYYVNSNKMSVNLENNHLPTGDYIVILQWNKHLITRKLMINNR